MTETIGNLSASVDQASGVADPAQHDPLEEAVGALASLVELPLEQHPGILSRFDALLRDALEASPPASSG